MFKSYSENQEPTISLSLWCKTWFNLIPEYNSAEHTGDWADGKINETIPLLGDTWFGDGFSVHISSTLGKLKLSSEETLLEMHLEPEQAALPFSLVQDV